MRRRFFIFFSLLPVLALGLCACAWAAGRADQNQPMNIDSDTLRYEEGSQTSTFSGHVVLTKGSILMRGARLTVQQDAGGNQTGRLDGGAGELAFFKQKRDVPGDEFVQAEAQTITYDSKNALVTLTGKAVFKRLQGDKPMDTVTGHVITYNSNTDIYTVNGGGPSDNAAQNGSASANGNGNGRVHVTLTTRADKGGAAAAPVPTASAASAAASSAANAVLKPSLQLKSAQP